MNYYSSGKLLISGEYLVIKGATALAVPLVFGQMQEVKKIPESNSLVWESFEKGSLWFECEIDSEFFEIRQSSDFDKADFLVHILKAAIELNPEVRNNLKGVRITTNTDFNLKWGFGSSSSLISNIAFWAGVDPFKLHQLTSTGSGYDVITARQPGPVLFKKLEDGYRLHEVDFKPSFRNSIFFIYLGKKQDTAKRVSAFTKKRKSFKFEIDLVNELSQHLAFAKTLKDFEFYMKEHEQVISSVLKRKPLKESRFRKLDGEIKSLGAWGGDFAMLTWNGPEQELKRYLKEKKIDVIFSFDELIKTR
jgi:mevalonate kinase